MGKRDKITETVRASLSEYEIGDRLPGVADVCARHGVSTATAVYAMRALVAEGLVRSEQGGGGGYFVSAHPTQSTSDLLTRLSDLLDETALVVRLLAQGETGR